MLENEKISGIENRVEVVKDEKTLPVRKLSNVVQRKNNDCSIDKKINEVEIRRKLINSESKKP